MTLEEDHELARLRAVADQQIAHIDATIDNLLLPGVRSLLVEGRPADACAVTSSMLVRSLGAKPQFLAEMLARLSIRYLTENSVEV